MRRYLSRVAWRKLRKRYLYICLLGFAVIYMNTVDKTSVTEKNIHTFTDGTSNYVIENGTGEIFFKRWPPLDTKNVRDKKLKFNPKQYPLELDLISLTKFVLAGKKIKNRPINPHRFNYIYDGRTICNISELFLVLVVKSKVDNFENRRVIRQTWGNLEIYYSVKIVFLIGFKKGLDRNIEMEATHFHDIVQEGFLDTYSNNTLKTIMGFNWVSKFCSVAKYHLFVDDDVFVIVQNIENFRQSNERGVMMGKKLPHSVPFRDKGSKWFVSWEDYPFDRYPSYLAGGAYLVSSDVSSLLAAAIPYVKAIRVDDSYIGIVASKLNIRLRNNPGIVMRNPGRYSQTSGISMNFRQVIAFHRIPSPESMIETWRNYCRQSNVCRW